jgi:hypothetical protein
MFRPYGYYQAYHHYTKESELIPKKACPLQALLYSVQYNCLNVATLFFTKITKCINLIAVLSTNYIKT